MRSHTWMTLVLFPGRKVFQRLEVALTLPEIPLESSKNVARMKVNVKLLRALIVKDPFIERSNQAMRTISYLATLFKRDMLMNVT